MAAARGTLATAAAEALRERATSPRRPPPKGARDGRRRSAAKKWFPDGRRRRDASRRPPPKRVRERGFSPTAAAEGTPRDGRRRSVCEKDKVPRRPPPKGRHATAAAEACARKIQNNYETKKFYMFLEKRGKGSWAPTAQTSVPVPSPLFLLICFTLKTKTKTHRKSLRTNAEISSLGFRTQKPKKRDRRPQSWASAPGRLLRAFCQLPRIPKHGVFAHWPKVRKKSPVARMWGSIGVMGFIDSRRVAIRHFFKVFSFVVFF